MKFLSTTICTLCVLFALGQSSFMHIESQHLQKRSTEYYGSLAEKPNNEKVDEEAFINYNPAIKFNGTDDYLKVTETIPEANQMTIFSVFKPSENSTEEFGIWNIQTEDASVSMTNEIADNTSNQLNYTGLENGKPTIHCYAQYYNTSAANYTDGTSYVLWGRSKLQDDNFFKGSMAELIAYNQILTATNKSKVMSSLAVKYGISLAHDQNYISSDNIIIWDAQNDSTYSHNITGIGRNDEQKLYQKQSTSSNNPNFLVIGVDAIQTTNEANEGILQDQYFMLWGDNEQPLQLNSNTPANNTIPVLERKWLMNVTGNTADDINTQLKIDASIMLNDSISSYVLAIDESGQGYFNKENTRFLYPGSISEEGIITYDKVQWDKDGSGKDVFSFSIENGKEDIDVSITDPISNVNTFNVFPSLSVDGNYKIKVRLERMQDIIIKVYDIAGKLLSNRNFSNQHIYLIDGLPIKTTGVYNITLETDEGRLTQKLVVEN